MKCFCKISLPAILFITLVGIIVYANTLGVPFAFDDFESIPQNSVIEKLENFYANSTGYKFLPNRYVAYLTFAFNYHFGGLEVSGYHVVNLAIHLLTALLVYALLRLTFSTPYFEVKKEFEGAGSEGETASASNLGALLLAPHLFIPFFAALLFVIHPLQTQAVTYIVQRTTSLAAMLYLLSMVCYVLARLRFERHLPHNVGRLNNDDAHVEWQGGALTFLAGSLVAAALAMKTKEIAFTLPLAAAMYEFFFFSGTWKRRLLFLLPLLATLAIIPMTLLGVGNQSLEASLLDAGENLRVDSNMLRSEYLFTQFRVIVTYLRLLILPVNQNIDYDYPTYTHFFTPPVFLSFLLLVAILVLALCLFWRSLSVGRILLLKKVVFRGSGPALSPSPCHELPACELRLIAFGLLWFFLTLSVESSFIPIADVIMEHRLYLPGFGAATAFAATVYLALRKWSNRLSRKLILAGVFSLVLLLGLATWQRNLVWGDTIRLWEDVVAKSPQKARPYNNLGFALTEAGRLTEAINTLSRAIELAPAHPHAYNNLGRAYLLNGQSKSALPMLKRAIFLNPEYVDAYISLAAAYNQSGQYLNTIGLLEKNLTLVGYRVEPHYHLAVAFASIGDIETSRKKQAMVARFDPDLAANLEKLLK